MNTFFKRRSYYDEGSEDQIVDVFDDAQKMS